MFACVFAPGEKEVPSEMGTSCPKPDTKPAIYLLLRSLPPGRTKGQKPENPLSCRRSTLQEAHFVGLAKKTVFLQVFMGLMIHGLVLNAWEELSEMCHIGQGAPHHELTACIIYGP